MDRRAFLRTGVLAGAIAAALPGCGWFGRDPLDLIDVPALDALALGVRGFDPAPFAGGDEPLEGLRRRIAAVMVEHGDRGSDLGPAFAAALAAQHAAGRTRVQDGWVLAEAEHDLLQLSARLHAAAGSTPRIAVPDPASAPVGEFLAVRAWGPRSACERSGFNLQSDGHSSFWIQLDGEPPQGLVVYVGEHRVPTTQVGNVVSTRIDPPYIDAWFGRAGALPVYLYSTRHRRRHHVGDFEVLPGGDFATTTDGRTSTVFREVVDWGPRSTPVDTPFNPQGEDDSAIWINTACAPPGARLRLGDRDLATTVSATAVSGRLRGRTLLRNPGKLALVLHDPASGESVQVGEFDVLPP